MIFQPLFAIATAVCLFYFLVLTRSAVRRVFVLAFFGVGIVFILYPGVTNVLAHWVGIGRGVDLILYVSTLFLFFLCFSFYLRFRDLEERHTRIVRELAIRHPVQIAPDPASTRSRVEDPF